MSDSRHVLDKATPRNNCSSLSLSLTHCPPCHLALPSRSMQHPRGGKRTLERSHVDFVNLHSHPATSEGNLRYVNNGHTPHPHPPHNPEKRFPLPHTSLRLLSSAPTGLCTFLLLSSATFQPPSSFLSYAQVPVSLKEDSICIRAMCTPHKRRCHVPD